MLITTTPSPGPGINYEVIGMVVGHAREYANLLDVDMREEAINLMVRQAQGLGANAIIETRFTTAAMPSMPTELLVYGTAVRIM